LEKETRTQEENSKLIQQLNSQSLRFEQTLSRTKANLAHTWRQVVSMHASERLKAEQQVLQVTENAEQTKEELEVSKAEVQNLRDTINRTQNQLDLAVSKVDELKQIINTLQQEVIDEKSKSKELSDEVRANREEIVSFSEKYEALKKEINDRETIISEVEGTNHHLQDNLEDLFADMCTLAQMYQHNEHQAASQEEQRRRAVKEVNVELISERKKNEELDSKLKGLQDENDKLYRKLGKYKERLEQERKERRDEQENRKEEENRRKRNGPVSYLNSLHSSTVSEKSSARHKSSSLDQSSSQRKSREENVYDKENALSSYYSTASQRRKHY
jgi:chromosome segregation ATPase